MCNFTSPIKFETEVFCAICKLNGNLEKILHSFSYENGKEETIKNHYHCKKCGFNLTPTDWNRLALREKEQIEKAKILFEETHLLPLNIDIKERGFWVNSENVLREIDLEPNSEIHISNTDFINKNPNFFVGLDEGSNFSLLTTPQEGVVTVPVIKGFYPHLNYLEIYLPIKYIKFPKKVSE